MSAERPEGPVLLCWDGSESAGRAMRQAAAIAGTGRRAVVLHVHQRPEDAGGALLGSRGADAPISSPPDADDRLAAGLRAAEAAGFEATSLLRRADGPTAGVIVAVAEELDAPLIVMGQRGRTGLRALVLGTVARDVVLAHHRPVLLVGPTPPAD